MKWKVLIYISSVLVMTLTSTGSYFDAKRKADSLTRNTSGDKSILIMPIKD